MWEQEGGEIMLVAPVCLCTYVSVCIAHMSQDMQLTGNKQLQTPHHTQKHNHTHTHTRPTAESKNKAKHTLMNIHTNKTLLNQCPVHCCVLKCHVHTQTLHTSLALKTHTFPHPHEK